MWMSTNARACFAGMLICFMGRNAYFFVQVIVSKTDGGGGGGGRQMPHVRTSVSLPYLSICDLWNTLADSASISTFLGIFWITTWT